MLNFPQNLELFSVMGAGPASSHGDFLLTVLAHNENQVFRCDFAEPFLQGTKSGPLMIATLNMLAKRLDFTRTVLDSFVIYQGKDGSCIIASRNLRTKSAVVLPDPVMLSGVVEDCCKKTLKSDIVRLFEAQKSSGLKFDFNTYSYGKGIKNRPVWSCGQRPEYTVKLLLEEHCKTFLKLMKRLANANYLDGIVKNQTFHVEVRLGLPARDGLGGLAHEPCSVVVMQGSDIAFEKDSDVSKALAQRLQDVIAYPLIGSDGINFSFRTDGTVLMPFSKKVRLFFSDTTHSDTAHDRIHDIHAWESRTFCLQV